MLHLIAVQVQNPVLKWPTTPFLYFQSKFPSLLILWASTLLVITRPSVGRILHHYSVIAVPAFLSPKSVYISERPRRVEKLARPHQQFRVLPRENTENLHHDRIWQNNFLHHFPEKLARPHQQLYLNISIYKISYIVLLRIAFPLGVITTSLLN